MACSITIYRVNGVVPTGGTQPTRLRVTGLAVDCPGGVVIISTNPPNLIAPMTMPAIPDGNGRFLIDVPLIGPVNCGDAVGLIVRCDSNPNCNATWNIQPLACCEVSIVSVDGVVLQGVLNPTSIRVTGTLYGCASDQVTISVPSIPAIAAQNVWVDPRFGGFSTQLPVPTGTMLACGGNIEVTAACLGGTCSAEFGSRGKPATLNCPQCFRADVSLTSTPCTGVAPNQTQPVTLIAQIGLPANGSADFAWHFGGGNPSVGPTFTITNTGGQSATATHVEPPHDYPPGIYTAELRRTDLGECPSVSLPVTITCNSCPQVTASVVVGACETSGPRAGSRPVNYTITVGTPSSATDVAYATIVYGGVNLATNATSISLQRTGPGPITHTAYLLPGTYLSTASVTIVSQQGVALCLPPLPPVSFTTRPTTATPAVDVGTCLPCPVSVTVASGQPVQPLPPPHVELRATVNWPTPPPAAPPNPLAYDWTITLPDGVTQAQIINGPATVNTTSSWSGAGSTGGAVNMTQGGSYVVSVTAKFGASAGLPVDPITGLTSCNLTGGTSVSVVGTPPTCPAITGITASAACADETQSISATITFTASVATPGAAVGQYQWDFGDSGSASNTASTAMPTAQHVYSKPGNYLITVSVGTPANCAAASAQTTLTIGRCPCPPGQTRDSAGICVSSSSGGGTTTPTSSFSWCCFLLVAWLIFNTIFGVLFYYGVYSYWPVGTIIFIVVGAIATILLILWIALCCWPCFSTFWRCCVFLQWQFIAASFVSVLLGMLQGACQWFPVLCGQPWVIAIYGGYAVSVILVLSAFARCGSLPNPFDRTTWPGCCCPGSRCP